jgi:hypothetical protein
MNDQSSTNWDEGQPYYPGWIGFITLLVPTFIMNVTVFSLVTFTKLNASGESSTLRYLMLEDAGFSLCCLLQCAINLGHMGIYGQDVGCMIQSFYATFFVFSAGYSLCVIAYNVDLKIHMKPGLTKSQILKIHILIWIWSASISILTSYVFPPQLMQSGTYCFPSLIHVGSGLIFYILGVGIIGTFLIHRYIKIYLYIQKVANNLTSRQNEAHARGVKASKKMLIFVICYFVCALPVFIVNLYEIISNNQAGPTMHLVAGHLVHLNSLLDPILYFWLNPNSRKGVLHCRKNTRIYEVHIASELNSSKIIVQQKINVESKKSNLVLSQNTAEIQILNMIELPQYNSKIMPNTPTNRKNSPDTYPYNQTFRSTPETMQKILK